jgi:hypothetical protein
MKNYELYPSVCVVTIKEMVCTFVANRKRCYKSDASGNYVDERTGVICLFSTGRVG